MAEKKPDKIADERLFTVPLRKEWLKVPLNKRAKRSVKTIKAHLSRHMKVPEADVRISAELNKAVWVRGAGKPPSKVRLKASFDIKTGNLNAMLPDEKPVVKEDKKGKKEEGKAEGKEPAGADEVPKGDANPEEKPDAKKEESREAKGSAKE